MTSQTPPTRLADVRGWLFDLDGVLTPTAEVHMRAWSRLFAPYLASLAVAPYEDADYYAHIDGRPRYDGVRSLLTSRSILRPEGEPDDSESADTICGLGNRKDMVFRDILRREEVAAYEGSRTFLDAVLSQGCSVAVVSSSQNAQLVLSAAGLDDRFDVVVDGAYASAAGLAGKPSPDTFLHAAGRLSLAPSACAVVEDAVSGVSAGDAGQFGHVVGVDRGAGARALREAGAHTVVSDLAELLPLVPLIDRR